MQLDPEALADIVVNAVDTAIGPLLERLAASDVRIATLEGLLGKDVSRVEGYTAYLQRDLSALGERVAVVETKTAIPAPAPAAIDLAPVLARLDVLEATPPARDGLPGVPGENGLDGASGPAGPPGDRGQEGHVGTPGRDGDRGPTGDKGVDGLIGPPGDRGPDGPAGPVRDGRDGLPGVPGVPGEKGLDGTHGRDGVDGLGFDDLAVLPDGERSVTFRFVKGDRVKDFAVTFPVEIYRGVYTDGKSYDRGDGVTWGGSEWHCNETTMTKPGDGSNAWTLKVKRGRDGKDGRDAINPMPVMSVGKR